MNRTCSNGDQALYYHMIAVEFGVKLNILNTETGCTVTVLLLALACSRTKTSVPKVTENPLICIDMCFWFLCRRPTLRGRQMVRRPVANKSRTTVKQKPSNSCLYSYAISSKESFPKCNPREAWVSVSMTSVSAGCYTSCLSMQTVEKLVTI